MRFFSSKKMSSQIDMFATQSPPKKKGNGGGRVNVPSTFPARLCVFKWVCLFDWFEGEEKPFKIYLVSKLGSEVKDAWLNSTVSVTSRQKKLTVSALNNKRVSLFGKIESSMYIIIRHFFLQTS